MTANRTRLHPLVAWTVLSFSLVGVMLGLSAGPAAAHADLVTTTPDAGVTGRGAVSEVRLSFASELIPDLTQVALRGDSEGAVAAKVTVDGADVVVAVDPLSHAGRYQVAYRAVAVDGHATEGTYAFDVSAASARAARRAGPAGPVANDPEPGATPATHVPQADSSWDAATSVVGAAGFVALLALGWLRRARKGPELSAS
jgi:copper resistance protein C